ncbi:MAG: hypothetical protein JRN45_11370 [Nitrososphaerota archaeon]|nr:hypothetical protein [Nitrososphaerota archaeon]
MEVQAVEEGERDEKPSRIKLVRWLSVPRYPPFDKYGVPRGPIKVSRKFYSSKLKRVFDFTWPAVFWVTAKQFAGKSTLIEDIMLEYIDHGGKAIDIFSADDDEGLGWLLWLLKHLERGDRGHKVLLLCGNKVDLAFREGSVARKLEEEGNLKWSHIGELKSRNPDDVRASYARLSEYQVVLTVPAFFYNANEMFNSLSDLIELLKQRGRVVWSRDGKREIYCLAVRESKVLLASRYYAGKIQSRQDAEMDLIDLVDKAFHTGVALAFDSLRYMSITPEVRDITHFTFIKKLGKMKLPREFNYVLRFAAPRWLRRMRKGQFCLYTDEDDVFFGVNEPVDWHIERGEAIMGKVGIDVVVNERSKRPQKDEAEDGTEQSALDEGKGDAGPATRKWKVSDSVHKRVVSLILEEGMSYSSAIAKMEVGDDVDPQASVKISQGTAYNEVKAHREKLCLCDQAEEGPEP